MEQGVEEGRGDASGEILEEGGSEFEMEDRIEDGRTTTRKGATDASCGHDGATKWIGCSTPNQFTPRPDWGADTLRNSIVKTRYSTRHTSIANESNIDLL